MVSIFWLPALYQTKTTSTKVVIFKVIPLEAANVEYTYFLTSRASLLSVCCISYDQAVTTWKVCDCNPFWMMTFSWPLTQCWWIVSSLTIGDQGSFGHELNHPGFVVVFWPHQVSLLLGEIPRNSWCRSSESSTAMENLPFQWKMHLKCNVFSCHVSLLQKNRLSKHS